MPTETDDFLRRYYTPEYAPELISHDRRRERRPAVWMWLALVAEIILLGVLIVGVAMIFFPAALIVGGAAGMFIVERLMARRPSIMGKAGGK